MMTNYSKSLMIILCFTTGYIYFSAVGHSKELNEIQFLTDESPPYSFTEGDKLQGISVDLLTLASEKSNSPISIDMIKLLPWPRAYRTTLNNNNSVIFPTTKTDERSPLFQWVGPISNTRIVAIAKRASAIKIDNMDDLKKHNIIVIRDDIGDHLLIAGGVADKNIRRATNVDSMIKMLFHGRAKLWVYEETIARWFLKENGLDNHDFETVYVLKESELYYAFNNSIDEKLVKLLQKNIDLLKRTKEENGKTYYQNILTRYIN